MKVIIAEKPSVAREIAAIVGASHREDGYLEGNGYAVTWAFGHLVGLAMPEAYGFTGFKRENLPILPAAFKLVPRQIKDGKEYKADPGALKQLKVIGELFNKCERIINCCDAGREGELIFRYIYTHLGCNKPFDRLWISSLTEKAIREGLQNLRPGGEYDNLYRSAKARSEADFLVGINASQALSITAGSGVWSLGRVQTPTLAMICRRYRENKNFVPVPYWQIKVQTGKENIPFSAVGKEKYNQKEQAADALRLLQESNTLTVTLVEKKEVRQEPPLLYDLTALQKDMNSKHGFSADKTLSIAQKLYEAKYITYPRTGSRYIPEDMAAEVQSLMTALFGYPVFGFQAAAVHNSELNPRSIDGAKVTDHHALLITGNLPKELPPDEQIVFDRIAGRMVEAFSKACIKDVVTVVMECSDIPFEVKGSVIKSAGWRKVFSEQDESEDDDAGKLPQLNKGEQLPITQSEVLEKQTKPKPLHTEASLLGAMEACGKDISSEEEREAIKDCGIGTPATRAAIIETLFSRDYIRREKKSLVPTDKGLTVYDAVSDKKIADVLMTGEWENALAKIGSGGMDAATFHKGIEVYAAQITAELLEAKIETTDTRATCSCPKCGAGKVVFYPKVAKCADAACGLTVFRLIAGKTLTDTQLTELLTKGKTAVIKGFKSKAGKSFDAALSLDADYHTGFVFEQKPGAKRGKNR